MEKGSANGKDKLVLVSAEWCGHCKSFIKDQLPELKKQLDKNKVEFKNYHIEGKSLGSDVPQHIRERVRGFPTLIFVPYKDWANGTGAGDKVFGSDPSSSGKSRTGEDVAKWANSLASTGVKERQHRIPSEQMHDNGGIYTRRRVSNDHD